MNSWKRMSAAAMRGIEPEATALRRARRAAGPACAAAPAPAAPAGATRGAIRLLDGDGREVADGEVGELYSRTAYVFDGYWKNPEKTAEAFRGPWCSVGDMARRNADGFIGWSTTRAT
ncbi:MAG: AMP-binding protein [Burkholderiaceae bacterium]